MTERSVVLRVNSHRASKKLASALGRKPQYSYTWEHGGCFVVLAAQEADSVLPITGITRSRMKPDQVSTCWN
jgi:hypothetical protein